MNCPYCEKEMREGGIPADRYAVRWLSGCREDAIWEAEREKVFLSEVPYIKAAEARAFYCPACRIVLVPVPEVETASDKLMQKWNTLTEKLGTVREEQESRRAEAKAKRKKAKTEGKDPWEL